MQAGSVFTPSAPVDQKRLFAGRTEQLHQIIDAVNQKGQHVLLFGERGVGKTSLASVLAEFLQFGAVLAPKVNAIKQDTYSNVWRKVFNNINVQFQTQGPGFNSDTKITSRPVAEEMPDPITADDVRIQLSNLAAGHIVIVIVDEFDRLYKKEAQAFADTIKMFSDHSVPATLVLVGVADSVGELIQAHQSVERALVQVRVPRMSPDELNEIITVGLNELGIDIEDRARTRIVHLSQGLPHYTHLLSLDAVRKALARESTTIQDSDVDASIEDAIERAQQSIKDDYHKATMSPRQDSLYPQVLTACALAETDELGFFAAKDVRGPMSTIMQRNYEIPAFSRHLNHFCDSRRGPVLERTGSSHRYRFRFIDPLLQPYVIMKGVSAGFISDKTLNGE